MLIEKALEAQDIVAIKLSNGDEILGRLHSQDQKTVTITKPVMMVLAQGPMGGPGIQLVPFWMFGADKDQKFPLNRDHVICMVKANTEAAKGYASHTTGLQMPGTGVGLVAP